MEPNLTSNRIDQHKDRGESNPELTIEKEPASGPSVRGAPGAGSRLLRLWARLLPFLVSGVLYL